MIGATVNTKGSLIIRAEKGVPIPCFHRSFRWLLRPSETVVVTKGVRFDKDQNSAFDETGLQVYFKRQGILVFLSAEWPWMFVFFPQ